MLRRSSRIATAAAVSAAQADLAAAEATFHVTKPDILPPYAPAGVTNPNKCFYIYPSTGNQCRGNQAPYDCVCVHHKHKRPAGAPIPCPPGHVLYPDPPVIDAALEAEARELWKIARRDLMTLKTNPVWPRIVEIYETIAAANPRITHPVVLEYSHPYHRGLAWRLNTIQQIGACIEQWKAVPSSAPEMCHRISDLLHVRI